jgi:hypothetical protein
VTFALAMIFCLLMIRIARELFVPILIVFAIGYVIVHTNGPEQHNQAISSPRLSQP